MNPQGFYDGPSGSTPDPRQSVNLYNDPTSSREVEAQDIPNYTGNPQVDAWVHSLPEDKRAEAVAEVTKPMTGEEIARAIDENRGFRFRNERDFLAYKDFRSNEERSILADFGDGMSFMGDIISTAVSQVGDAPGEAALKFVPSVVEGAYQALRDTVGLVSQSSNPNSVVFRFRHALLGTGTIQDQMRQTNEALAFNEYGDKLLRGEETAIIDKDLVHPGVTQVAAILADPTALVPFGKAAKFVGISNLAMKGAKALGAGATLAEVAIKAQKIKTAAMAGTLKWAVGMPLDAIGSAVSGTIDYSISKFGKVVELSTGLAADDVARATRLAGAGTATAGLAGVTIPYATAPATAYFSGQIARGAGEAIALISEQMQKQAGHRGLFSYAEEALALTKAELAKRGGVMNPATEKMLKLIDKLDPFISYTSDIAEGFAVGGVIGGALGGLNEGVKGVGFGAGMGAVGGVVGAGTGRLYADARGHTFMERLHVTAEFARRLYAEKDPVSGMFIKRIMDDPRSNSPEFKVMMDKFAIALGKVDGEINFRAIKSEEFKKYLERLERDGVLDPNDPTPERFKNAEGYSIRRRANGATEIVINLDYLYKKDESGRLTVAHEFLHGFLASTTMGEVFKKKMRDTILGFRTADGRVLTRGSVPMSEFKDFIKAYWLQGVEYMSKDMAAAQRGKIAQWTRAVERYEKQGQKGEPPLSPEDWVALDQAVEEFSAHYFSAWFDKADAYMLARGGRQTGIRSIMESVKNSFLDTIEDRIALHEPMFRFHRGSTGGKTDVTNYFYKDGKRVRVGALDYLLQDLYTLSSGLRERGYIDTSEMTPREAAAFFEGAGLDEIAVRTPKGRWRPRKQEISPAERKVLGESAQRVLEQMDQSARTSKMDADGVIRGPFSDAELNALVDAGLMSRPMADNFRLLQFLANDKTGMQPNVVTFGYFGAERGLSETNDNLRASGDRVPFTNRKALIIEAIGEISKDGKFSFRARSLDMRVMERRALNMWTDPAVRAAWGDDFSHMMSDFFEVYLTNISKPHNSPDRRPSAALWINDGEFKRDVMHQIAGFAKGEDTPYINTPLARIPRGTLSAVTDFSVGRMHVIGPAQNRRVVYDHANAFRDIAANFKLAHSSREEAPGGTIYRTETNYTYKKDSDGFTVIDPYGSVIAKEPTAARAEDAALSDYEQKAYNEFSDGAKRMFSDFNAGPAMFKNWSNAAEIVQRVREVYRDVGEASFLDFTQDSFHLVLADMMYGSGGRQVDVEKLLNGLSGLGIKTRVNKKGDSIEVYVPRMENSGLSVEGTDVRSLISGNRIEYESRKIPIREILRESNTLYMLSIFEAVKNTGALATLGHHFSTSGALHRSMRFLSEFHRTYDGLQETGFWFGPNLQKTWKPGQFDIGAQGAGRLGDAGQIRLEEGSWSRSEDNRPVVPALVALIHGKNVQWLAHDKSLWTFEHILGNRGDADVLLRAEAKANPSDNTLSRYGNTQNYLDAVARRMDEIVSGKKDNRAIATEHSNLTKPFFNKTNGDQEYRSIRSGLNDRIQRIYSGKIMREQAAKGVDMIVWNDVRANPGRDILMSPLTRSQKGPQENIIPLSTNVDEQLNRSTAPAPLQILSQSINEIIGSLRGPKLKIPTFNEYIANDFRNAMDDHVNMWFEGMLGKIDTDAALTRRTMLGNMVPFAIAPINREVIGRVSHELETLRRDIEQQFGLLSEADFMASLGERNAQLQREAKEHTEMAEVYTFLYNIFSTLDDDFIRLADDGRQFIVDSDPALAFRAIRKANNYLDRLLSKQDDPATSGEQKAIVRKIEAVLSTISPEFSRIAGGMFQLVVTERKAINPDSTDSNYSGPIDYISDSEMKPRLTFVWSDEASAIRQFYIDMCGRDAIYNDQGMPLGWENLRLNTAVIERLRNDPNFPARERELATKLQNFRSETSNYYRSFVDKATNEKKLAQQKGDGIQTYQQYIQDFYNRVSADYSMRVMDYIRAADPEIFIGPDKQETRKYILSGGLGNGATFAKVVVETDSRIVSTARAKEILDTLRASEANGSLPSGSKDFVLARTLKNVSPSIQHVLASLPETADFATEGMLMGFVKELEAINNGTGIISTVSDGINKLIKKKQEKYKDIAYEGTFRSGLMDAVEVALQKFPTGITAQNLIKELERINSVIPVLEEARVTGFADYLREKAKAPRDKQTGKFPKLDLKEMMDFLEANKIEVIVSRDKSFDVDREGEISGQAAYIVHPTNNELVKYGNIALRATDTLGQKRWPALDRGNHVGPDTYVWNRFTIRTHSDGRKVVYLEESQSQNNLANRESLRTQSDFVEKFEQAVKSNASIEAIQKLLSETSESSSLPVHQMIAQVLNELNLKSTYNQTDFLSALANASGYAARSRQDIAMNSAVRPYLRFVGRLAEDSGIISRAAFDASNGSAVLNHINEQVMTGNRKVYPSFLENLAKSMATNVKESTATITFEGDGISRQGTIGDAIESEKKRVVLANRNAGSPNNIDLREAAITHALLDFALNKMTQSGMLQRIVEVSTEFVATEMRKGVKRRDYEGTIDWFAIFERAMESNELRKKISDMVKDSLLIEKQFTIPTGIPETPTATVKFSTKAGAVNFYKEVLKSFVRNQDRSNPDYNSYEGAWVPQLVREAFRNKIAMDRDRAIFAIISHIANAGNAMDVISASFEDAFPKGRSTAYSIVEGLVSGLDGKTGDIVSTLLELNPNSAGANIYVSSIHRLGDTTVDDAKSVANTTEWLTGQGKKSISNFIDPSRSLASAGLSMSHGYATVRSTNQESTKPVGQAGVRVQAVTADAVYRKLLGKNRYERAVSSIDYAGNRYAIGVTGPGRQPTLLASRGEAVGVDGYSVFFDTAALFRDAFESSPIDRRVFRALSEHHTVVDGGSSGTRGYRLGKEYAQVLRDPLREVGKLRSDDHSMFNDLRADEDGELPSHIGSTTRFYNGIGSILANLDSSMSVDDVVQRISKVVSEHVFPDRLRKALNQYEMVPFLESKEYFALAAKALLRTALVEGADAISMTTAADGGSNSNLSPGKAMDIYDALVPSNKNRAYSKLGLKMRPPTGLRPVLQATPEQTQALYAATVEHRQNRIKLLGELVSLKKAPGQGTVYSPKPNLTKAFLDFFEAYKKIKGDESVIADATLFADKAVRTFEQRMSGQKSESVKFSRGGGVATTLTRTAMDAVGDAFSAVAIAGATDGTTAAQFKKLKYETSNSINTYLSHPYFEVFFPNDYRMGLPAYLLNEQGVFVATSMAAGTNGLAGITRTGETPAQVYARVLLDTAKYLHEVKGFLGADSFATIKKIHEMLNLLDQEVKANSAMLDFFKFKSKEQTEILIGRALSEDEWNSGPPPSNVTDILTRGPYWDLKGQLTDEARKTIMEKGQTFYKLASGDSSTRANEVSPGSRPWRSGFIGSAAASNPDVARVSRLISTGDAMSGFPGGSINVSLIPRGNEPLGVDSPRIQVIGVITPNRMGDITVVSEGLDGNMTAVAIDEVRTRLGILGANGFTPKQWGLSGASNPAAKQAANASFKLTSFESTYANYTEQGREVVDRLNAMGYTMYWGLNGSTHAPDVVIDGTSSYMQGFYNLAIRRKNETPLGIHVKVEFSPSKTVAKIQSSSFPSGLENAPGLRKSDLMTQEEFDYIERRQSVYTDVELKQVILAELMLRLKRMGVDHVEGLEGMMTMPQDRIVQQAMDDYSDSPLPTAVAVPLSDDGSRRMPYEYGAEVLREENIEFKGSNFGTRISAKIPDDISYKLAWTTRQEGAGTTVTSDKGHLISSSSGKHRLFDEGRRLVGVFSDVEKAKKKAEALNKRTKK